MCGIIAAFNTEPKKKTESANEFVINQYQEQFDRGTKGFGIVRISQKGVVDVDRACEPTKFLMDLYLKKSKMIIAHHRTPTSTDNKLDQTHPMFVSNNMLEHDYLVVHNGVIGNTIELRKKHIELGFVYTTEYEESSGYTGYQYKREKWNDSESLAIELALFIEKKITAVGIDNNAAFIVLQMDKKTHKAKQVFFGRNGFQSCLNMSKVKGRLRISSEGEGEEVEVNKLFSFKTSDKSMYLTKKDIEFTKPVPISTVPTVVTATTETKKTNEATLLDVLKSNGTVVKEESPSDDDPEDKSIKPRAWVSAETWMRDAEYIIYPLNPTKGYIEDLKQELKEKMKDETSSAITHIIDDSLDEQVEGIFDLINEFKSQLMTRRFENGTDFQAYTSQIFRMIRGMKEAADVAEAEYTEKAEIEMQEEIDDYTGSCKHMGFTPMDALEETDIAAGRRRDYLHG